MGRGRMAKPGKISADPRSLGRRGFGRARNFPASYHLQSLSMTPFQEHKPTVIAARICLRRLRCIGCCSNCSALPGAAIPAPSLGSHSTGPKFPQRVTCGLDRIASGTRGSRAVEVMTMAGNAKNPDIKVGRTNSHWDVKNEQESRMNKPRWDAGMIIAEGQTCPNGTAIHPHSKPTLKARQQHDHVPQTPEPLVRPTPSFHGPNCQTKEGCGEDSATK